MREAGAEAAGWGG